MVDSDLESKLNAGPLLNKEIVESGGVEVKINSDTFASTILKMLE